MSANGAMVADILTAGDLMTTHPYTTAPVLLVRDIGGWPHNWLRACVNPTSPAPTAGGADGHATAGVRARHSCAVLTSIGVGGYQHQPDRRTQKKSFFIVAHSLAVKVGFASTIVSTF
jgi:hypothetical protein